MFLTIGQLREALDILAKYNPKAVLEVDVATPFGVAAISKRDGDRLVELGFNIHEDHEAWGTQQRCVP